MRKGVLKTKFEQTSNFQRDRGFKPKNPPRERYMHVRIFPETTQFSFSCGLAT